MRVLDLGAGEGKHARMFRDMGGIVTAVDQKYCREWEKKGGNALSPKPWSKQPTVVTSSLWIEQRGSR